MTPVNRGSCVSMLMVDPPFLKAHYIELPSVLHESEITPERVSERSPTPLKEGRFCEAKVRSDVQPSKLIQITLRVPQKKQEGLSAHQFH
jgi:hypothetical protein